MGKVLNATLVVPIAVFLGMCGYLDIKPAVLWYRASTSAMAMHSVLTLPQDHIDDFMKSYEIFDQEFITSNEKDADNIVNYYKVLNHLCAVGQVEKMYIPPVMDKQMTIFSNQDVWEETGMADKLDIGPGKKVLDVGCGRGRIAHHVASYTGAQVTGLNIDQSQLAMGKEYAEKTGMSENLQFVHGNYNKPLPFADNTFDALYHVQALTYAEDLSKLMKEMHRVIKPGAKISFLDFFQLKDYNQTDPHHQKLLRETKAIIGAVRTPTPEEYHTALVNSGFDVIFSGEASVDGGRQFPLLVSARAFFETATSLVHFLARFSLVPNHLPVLMDRLTAGGDSFEEADRLGLFTTSWQIIAQKK